MTTVQEQPRPGGVDWIDQNRRLMSNVLFGAALVLVVLAPFLWWKFTWDLAKPWITFCAVLGLGACAAGAWIYQSPAGGAQGRDSARLFLLSLGGGFGAVLLFSTLWQAKLWWSLIVGGTATWQDRANWHLWLLPALTLVGVALIFASLLLVRGEEHTNPRLRRTLYGYNALLTGVLLLAILVILNVLAYLYLPPSSDWTAKGIYTLSTQSENVLKGLDRPVKVYVLIEDRGTRYLTEVRDLLDNCRSLSDKLSVEYLVRDLNVEEVDRLSKQYSLPDSVGLLVVYGSGDQESYQFIRRDEMYQQAGRMDPENPQRGPSFKGEDALISAIQFLEEGKKKPIVYFLQGEGELDLFGAIEGGKQDRKAQTLRDQLSKHGYEVKGLRLAAGAAKTDGSGIVVSETVPDDATVVVIAGPHQPFAPEALDALRKYMAQPRKEKDTADPKKERTIKGKLFAMMDVVPGPGDRMLSTGLENLLAEFDLEVSNDRILRPVKGGRPNELYVMANQNPDVRARNPLAANLNDRVPMIDVRPVQAHPAERPGAPASYQTDTVLLTAPPIYQLDGAPVWPEADLRAPLQIIAELVNEKKLRNLQQKLLQTIPVGVAVSDAAPFDPTDPHAGMRGPEGDGTPRVLAIGNARFASDASLLGGGGNPAAGAAGYELVANGLAWLREKPNSIGISPKDRGIYKMKEGTDVDRMVSMPFYLMALGIMGLGLGVWVVRRR